MQLTSQQVLPVPQDVAWRALNDIELLRDAMPGCESITPTGENEYETLLTAAIGPVKAKFKGKLRLSDLQPPKAYTINFEGQGGAAGHGKGSAQVTLEPQGSTTVLHYTVHASVGGKIAQVGSRLVDMAAQKMAGDFFESFNEKLQARYGAAPAPAVEAAKPEGWLQRLLARLRRLFGGE